MEIFKIVLKMLEEKKRGVLITILDGSPLFLDLPQKHGLWFADDPLTLREDIEKYRLKNIFSGFRSEKRKYFQDNLNALCQKVLAEGVFYRQKLTLAEEWVDMMLEPILPPSRLIILGCGHVGQALAKLANIVEIPAIVVDDRPIFANIQNFPQGTRVICDDFDRAVRDLVPTETDLIVIVTRGHSYDRLCLETLAGTKLIYIGMIGSKRRVKELMSDLIREGIDPDWLSGVHSPIGLDIKAETPAEIAVSIMAEIIQIIRKGVHCSES